MPDSDAISWKDWVLKDAVFAVFVVMGRQPTATAVFLLNCHSGRVSR